ncbi:hypothetical protein ORL62_29380 [Bacillus cereus]|uniref:hypothetical protein n=1 Tax=Bacillus cereus group TaxID=86661 RepID=UPI000FE3F38D|nr:hypothetical protein [Bacillus cereus]MDA2645000.1 hypothetical protein [Bacillus cereus]MDZ4411909.1 hypothetical protein [Bacillus cereus]RWR54436.1 hypothetical protein DYR28_29135 [Bacillus cereus]
MFYPEFEGKRLQFIQENEKYKPLINRFTADNKTSGEIPKYFTFNETGNIMISSTAQSEDKINPKVLEAFNKAIVFFGAISAAMNRKGKNLYDYDALSNVIASTGQFIPMHKEDRTFSQSSTQFTLNTAIINDVLGNVNALGSALEIAKKVVNSIGGQLRVSASGTSNSKKVAHLLFVCENLMGMPIINISLFYVDTKESQSVQKSNCNEFVHDTVEFKYHQEDFMFVDPEYINKFSEDFKKNPEYDKLIENLANAIK